jgi:hypothetical protein
MVRYRVKKGSVFFGRNRSLDNFVTRVGSFFGGLYIIGDECDFILLTTDEAMVARIFPFYALCNF